MEINIDSISSLYPSIVYDDTKSIDAKYFNSNYGYKRLPVIFKQAFRGEIPLIEYLDGILKTFNCWLFQNDKLILSEEKIFEKKDHISNLSIEENNIDKWRYLASGKTLWFIYSSIFNTEISTHFTNYQLEDIEVFNKKTQSNLIRPFFAIQEPGDLIYIPGNNYSIKINIEDCTFYENKFINEINYDTVRTALRKNDVELYQQLEQAVRANFERLKSIK